MLRRGSTPTQQLRPPDRIEKRLHPWRLAQRRVPQCRGLGRLVGDRHTARVEKGGDEPLQMLRMRVVQAGFPVLDRPAAHAHSRGELTLGQPGAPTVAQQQSLKRLCCAINRLLFDHGTGAESSKGQPKHSGPA